MATTSPVTPKVATALGHHRKRRHSAIDKHVLERSGGIGGKTESSPTRASNGHLAKTEYPVEHEASLPSPRRRLEDDDDEDEDDDTASLIEDILDTAELAPYKNGESSLTVPRST